MVTKRIKRPKSVQLPLPLLVQEQSRVFFDEFVPLFPTASARLPVVDGPISIGYKPLMKLEHRPFPQGSGRAAYWFAREKVYDHRIQSYRNKAASAVGAVWWCTGAPGLKSSEQFEWLLAAYMNYEISGQNRDGRSELGVVVSQHVFNCYRLIRQFAEFCKSYTDEGSDAFLEIARLQRKSDASGSARFGDRGFDQLIQLRARKYLTLIPQEFRLAD
jgi:hypothetical protein